ncbi:MAG: glycosyltransferase family 2 protein [Bacteroidota bacterium]
MTSEPKYPKILVLLSTYNGEKYLADQLESLKKQKSVELYYLIRDDGSSDQTLSILKKFSNDNPRSEVIEGTNVGLVQSFHQLLIHAYKQYSEIDYFAFCDQDDVWLEHKLITGINKLQEMPSIKPSLYCSNLILIDENGNYLGEMRKRNSVSFSKASSLVESISTGCTMIFNKKTIELYNIHTPTSMIMHDLWIYHTCLFLGNVYYDDTPHILYRQHGKNQIGAKATFSAKWKSRIRSLKNLKRQYFRENEAKTLLNTYDDLLMEKDKKLISTVANYKENLKSRIKLFFHTGYPDLRMSNREKDFWLKIRILLGKV